MRTLAHDIRFALRILGKHPGFAAIAILTLALGVGATTSIFTVVEAVLLRPLPYPNPEQVVHVQIRGADGDAYPLPDTDFLAWRERSDAFSAIGVYFSGGAPTLTGEEEPQKLIGVDATDRVFAALGVPAMIGRTFEPGDDRPGAPKTVVLSHAFWQRRFHGDRAVVGRAILLDGVPHAVIGVMPPAFVFPRADTDVWPILTMRPPSRRGPFYTFGVARLKEGVSLAQALASLDPVEAAIKERHRGPTDWRYEIVPLYEQTVANVRRILYLLFGAVGFLLLIATANVANLTLARAASRHREIAVRGALGAGRSRLAAQLVTESVVLSLFAAVLGLAIAAAGTRVLVAFAPERLPRLGEIHMSVPVFLFALAVSTIAGVLFGLVPALRASRIPLVESLKEGGRGSLGPGHRRVQRALVAAEIALALMLSIGAGLMIRSIAALGRVNPGFQPTRLLTMEVSLPPLRYDTRAKVTAFYDALQARIRAIAGVESAGYTVSLPPDRNAMTDSFMVDGMVLAANQSPPVAPLLFVDEDYFKTLGVPLVAGRFFEQRDAADQPPVVIVNETLARRYFPDGSAVGKRLKDGGPERPNNPWMEVIGVVGDVKYQGLDAPPEPAFYLPFRQSLFGRRFAIVRTASEPRLVLPAIRAAIAALDAELPLSEVSTVEELMSLSVAAPRFRTTLVAVFAGIGLLLAAIGIYGVVAYAVTERMRELGVRVALGASSRDVVRLVLGETLALTAVGIAAGVGGETLALTAVGIAAGVGGALVTTRLMASLLFGVAPTDVPTFAAIAVVLVATALLAGYLPARRATRVDPMIALRAE